MPPLEQEMPAKTTANFLQAKSSFFRNGGSENHRSDCTAPDPNGARQTG